MYVPFHEIPDTARIWIYQSNRPLNFEEVEVLSAALLNFTDSWTAHNKDLKASFQIFHSRFLILTVDETLENPSGCSIDSSVHFLQKAGESLGLDWFNRTLIYYRAEGEHIECADMREFKEMIGSGEVDAHTFVFNNMLQSKAQLADQWEVQVLDSWHKQLL
jgi:hypothetical protein